MKPTLSAVMAYEDAGTARRAREAWEHLAHALKDNYGLELRLWKFDALRLPELKGLADTDAARADIILVATRGGEVPTVVRSLIEQWLKSDKEDEKSAPSVLLDAPSDNPDPSRLTGFAFLQDLARQGGVDFFRSTLDQPGENKDSPRLQNTQQPQWHRAIWPALKEGERFSTALLLRPKAAQPLSAAFHAACYTLTTG